MSTTIGINGMGVVGRELLRQLYFNESYAEKYLVALINDANITIENLVYLLKYDSVYHDYETKDITMSKDSNSILINNKKIQFSRESKVSNVGWGDNSADIVFDCTGQAKTSSNLQEILDSGAKKVIACYPVNDVPLVVYDANHDTFKYEDKFLAMPYIEEQVASIVLNQLYNNYGLDDALVKSFSAYTNAQQTIDSLNASDFGQGRAGAWNIIPYTASYPKNIGKVIAALNDRVNGMSYRAPVIVGGAVDITAVLSKQPTSEEIYELFSKSVAETIETTTEPLASSDVIGLDKFLLLKGSLRQSKDLTCLTVLYDNIRGLTLQVLRLLTYMDGKGLL